MSDGGQEGLEQICSAVGELVALILRPVFGPSQKPPPAAKPYVPPTPQEMNITRACLSSGLLAGLAYVPFYATAWFGKGPAAILADFIAAPLDPPAVLVAWLAAVAIGAVYLTVGLRGAADGPHAGLWAFWSAALPIVSGVVLVLHAPELLGNPMVRGFCLVVASCAAMRFFIAIRGGSAERAVRRNIKRKNAPLRPARRRRWLFF